MAEKQEFSKQFIDSLISSSKSFRSFCPDVNKLPKSFNSLQEGIELFRNSLSFEGNQAFQSQLTDYSEPLLCCVDLDTNNPGIVTKYSDDYSCSVVYSNGNEKEYSNIYDLKLFTSPIPFDRHINALSHCKPNKFLESIVLHGKEAKTTVVELKEMCRAYKLKVSGLKQELIDRLEENYAFPTIKLFHGPPGTGKTYTILQLLKDMLTKLPKSHRFLICAPSNVGTINMYTRARDTGLSCTLVMREDKTPDGTHITDEERESWDPKNARIVFSTVSGRCGSILRKEEFHTIIVDEAAQCQESWAWGLLRPELVNLIMAGDPHQLPAQVSDIGNEMNHGISLMERLMAIGYSSVLLNTQRRMHPVIAEFPNNAFYDGKLGTDFDIKFGNVKPYEIIGVNSPEEKYGTSYRNDIEAKVVVSLANKLRQTFKDTIVISPYKGQCDLLKKLDSTLIIHTVDSFQGKEADAIILTTVRNGKSVGFWQDSRRLNVALTRAKHVLRIVGSIPTWKKSNTVMTELANHADSNSYVKSLTPFELVHLNIDLKLSDVYPHLKNTKWGVPIIDSRAINTAKNNSELEHGLAKIITKVCNGIKHKTTSLLNSTTTGSIAVDWNVFIDENTKQLKLKFYNVRYSGTHSHVDDLISCFEKLGPEWNEKCKYELGPITLDELPYKGRRPMIPKKEPPRDRLKEKLAAQQLVASFRR